MDIKAAVVREKGGKFEIEDLQLEDPKEHEVLVRVVGCGVCHTDLAVRDQFYPTPLPCVLGHEGSGIVEKVGSHVSKVKPGDHVVMSYLSCGECGVCKSGKMGYCSGLFAGNFSGKRFDGTVPLKKGTETIYGCFFSQSSFATYALATDRNVVKVDEDIPLEMLGPLGCGIQTGAGAVMNALKPQAGTSIAVFGVGAVGLSAIMGAQVCGCTKIIAVDINEERLAQTHEYGATHTVNSQKVNPVEAIKEITGGGADFSVEAIGKSAVVRQAFDSLSTMGVCGVIGCSPLGTEVTLDLNDIMFGKTIRGIIEGDAIPEVFIPRLIELYKQGRFPFDKMLKYYSFDAINEAVKDLETGNSIKGILKM